jgi:hypothetical protein
MKRGMTAVVCVAALTALGAATTAAAAQPGVEAARQATARFHDVSQATGYGRFTDAAGIACIDNPGVGGMGIHYVNGALVGDPDEDARTPEALVYDPDAHGHLRLAAVEYIVDQAAWDALHAAPPSLFGEPFELVGAGNRYGLDPFYELHAWLWKPNPRGFFDNWNPRVFC